MNNEQLQQGKKLKSKMDSIELLLMSIKTQKTEWVIFTHGNGSDTSSVTFEQEDIAAIKELLNKSHKARLKKLQTEFENI